MNKEKVEEIKRQFLVALKAFLKGIVIAGSGLLTVKLGGSNEVAVAIAGFTHTLIKIIDPSDNSIGFNLEK